MQFKGKRIHIEISAPHTELQSFEHEILAEVDKQAFESIVLNSIEVQYEFNKVFDTNDQQTGFFRKPLHSEPAKMMTAKKRKET